MTKKQLLKALESFDDDDHLMINGEAQTYVDIERICGKTHSYMSYYCVLGPDHEGDCYSSCKCVEFDPND